MNVMQNINLVERSACRVATIERKPMGALRLLWLMSVCWLIPCALHSGAQESAAVETLSVEPAALDTRSAVQEPAALDTLSASEPELAFTHDSITVTARRMDEELQDVPVSVTAISSEDLERRQ